MRSIDNLREWANGLHGVYINQVDHTITVTTGWDAPPDMDSVSLRDHVNGILDGIEREVADMVPLPDDADGVPIHVGDVMEWCDSGDTLEVIGIGDDTIFYIDRDSDRTYAEWTAARNKRHHYAPTVESVLAEMLGIAVALCVVVVVHPPLP